jgi:malate dehydrogenase (oxaloacetate-decarboxylating)(NADP+)
MKIAAVEAIAKLARVEASEVVAAAYGGAAPVFGPDYIIPKPFDPRLILEIAPAVARAAIESGVARRPITDFVAYQRDLERFVFRSGFLMRPVFAAAMRDPKRVVFAEGEDERILRAAQTLVDDTIARPILLGRRDVIAAKVKEMGLRIDLGKTVEVLDPALDHHLFDKLIPEYQRLAGRRGIPPEPAARRIPSQPSVAAAMLLHQGHADAAICGGTGAWWRQIQYILPIIPRRPDVNRVYALSCLIISTGVLFMCDTFMVTDPTA